jgi:hypothetical protein
MRKGKKILIYENYPFHTNNVASEPVPRVIRSQQPHHDVLVMRAKVLSHLFVEPENVNTLFYALHTN